MKSLWRVVVWTGVLALLTMVFFIVRSNVRTADFQSAVRAGDATEVARLLGKQPDLLSDHVMPQGSRSTTGKIRWRGRRPMHLLLSGTSGDPVLTADAMLAAGLNLDDRLNGESYLHVAAEAGDLALMAWLLDKGVDVDVRNGCQHPEEALCSSGRFADWPPFDRQRAGGTVCAGCDREGQTPLHAAQRSMRADEGSRLLLGRGADIQARDAAGRTVLHVAAMEGRTSDEARLLCGFGADPAVRDRSGRLAADLAREAEAANSVDRYSQTGPGELAGWLAPGSGCAALAARAHPGAPVPDAEVDAAWRTYVCTRDPKYCAG